MKLKDAIELGQDCGLTTPEESVNNVLVHDTMMFPYGEIAKEEAELLKEAKDMGMLFCHCGLAKFKDDGDDCYICKKFKKLDREAYDSRGNG